MRFEEEHDIRRLSSFLAQVMSDEDIPADLLCLYCDLEDNVCFIKTTGLDGALSPCYC